MLKFTSSLEKAIAQANQVAQKIGHDQVAPEHLLLGLLKAERSIAAQVLQSLELGREHLEGLVMQKSRLPLRSDDRSLAIGRLPHTPELKAAVALASENATTAGRGEIDTGDMLQTLCEQSESLPQMILADRRIDSSFVAERIARLRSEGRRDGTALQPGDIGK